MNRDRWKTIAPMVPPRIIAGTNKPALPPVISVNPVDSVFAIMMIKRIHHTCNNGLPLPINKSDSVLSLIPSKYLGSIPKENQRPSAMIATHRAPIGAARRIGMLRVFFLKKLKKPVKISQLQTEVWGHNSKLETHTVETHIYRLRTKISKNFKDNNFIISTKQGYSISKK